MEFIVKFLNWLFRFLHPKHAQQRPSSQISLSNQIYPFILLIYRVLIFLACGKI